VAAHQRTLTALGAIVLLLGCAACSTWAETETAQRSRPAALRDCTIAGITGTVRCGTVRVAESSDPSSTGRHIDLRVIVVPARATAPAPDAILPLVGGPGQGAADLAATLAQRLDFLRDERDLLLVDQRGTGQSNGLHCNQTGSARDLMGKLFDRVAECRDLLLPHADLTQYTTTAAAGDYERVFDELGYRQVNVIGNSYGSRMGLELARRFPLRVRTLTIESVVPTTFDWPSMAAADADAALQAVVDDCAADRSCSGIFPRFRQDIDLAFTRVRRGSVTATVRDPLTGTVERVPFGETDLAYATRGLLYGNEAWSLPSWFRLAAEGGFEAFAQAYVTRARALDAQIALGVHFGVYCTEDLPFVDWSSAEKAAAGTHLAGYLIDQYRRACEVWPKGSVPASYREPVQSSVPALLISGRRDPVTPPRTAEYAARTLSRGRVLTWRYGGHGTDGLVSSDCRAGIQRSFIQSADSERLPIECATRDPVRSFNR
jgi:pimeloyl-ACP methyl ester carboxylesterase